VVELAREKIIRDELYELELDIDEWIEILEERGRKDSQRIWYNFNTRKILKLTRELLTDFKKNIALLNGRCKKEKALFTARAKEVELIINRFGERKDKSWTIHQ